MATTERGPRRLRSLPGVVVAATTAGVTGASLAWAVPGPPPAHPTAAPPPSTTTTTTEPPGVAEARAEVAQLEGNLAAMRQTLAQLTPGAAAPAPAPAHRAVAPAPGPSRPAPSAAPAPRPTTVAAKPAPAPAPAPATHTTTGASSVAP